VPWPFLRLYSNRLPSWVKNYKLSGDVDNARGKVIPRRWLGARDPFCMWKCAINAPWVVAACRWDVGRQCGAEETRGNPSQTSDFRLVRNFFATLRAQTHIMRQIYGGPKLPQELRAQVGGMYTSFATLFLC
jgi:hypothetical protein